MTLRQNPILLFLVLCSGCSIASTSSTSKPNIVFILTDDQDVVLGGLVSSIHLEIAAYSSTSVLIRYDRRRSKECKYLFLLQLKKRISPPVLSVIVDDQPESKSSPFNIPLCSFKIDLLLTGISEQCKYFQNSTNFHSYKL